jgi:hypothetical protein
VSMGNVTPDARIVKLCPPEPRNARDRDLCMSLSDRTRDVICHPNKS